MKKIIIAVALLLLLATLIGTLVYFNTPKELRALKKDIKRNGEYSESSDTRLLTVADTTKAYTGENGTVVLYRIDNNEADGYVCLVRIFFNKESLKSGLYEWDADISHTREGDFKMKGSFEAAKLSEENKDIGFAFTYGGDRATALMKIYLEGYVFDTLSGALDDFSGYLAASEVGYTLADYGFENIK